MPAPSATCRRERIQADLAAAEAADALNAVASLEHELARNATQQQQVNDVGSCVWMLKGWGGVALPLGHELVRNATQ